MRALSPTRGQRGAAGGSIEPVDEKESISIAPRSQALTRVAIALLIGSRRDEINVVARQGRIDNHAGILRY
jgi:hypothetical protein